MARLNWTEQAAVDLKNIFEYISVDSPRYAAIHIKRIREKARLLRKQPLLGRIVPEKGNENIRELIFGNYRIIYRIVSQEQIDIITIFHSARILNLS